MVKAFNGMRAKTCPTKLTGSRYWHINGDETGDENRSPGESNYGLARAFREFAGPKLHRSYSTFSPTLVTVRGIPSLSNGGTPSMRTCLPFLSTTKDRVIKLTPPKGTLVR